MTLREIQGSKSFFVAALLAPLVLVGCGSSFGPFAMPTGYTYHGQTYKAPPGPEPYFKKLERDVAESKERVPLPNDESSPGDAPRAVTIDRQAAALEAGPEPGPESKPELAPGQEPISELSLAPPPAPIGTPESPVVQAPPPLVTPVPVMEPSAALAPAAIPVPALLAAPARNSLQPPPAPKAAPAAASSEEQQWTVAATDLLARLERHFGHPVEPVSVAPAIGGAVISQADLALRSALTARGFTLAGDSVAAKYAVYILKYSAIPISGPISGGDSSRVLVTVTLTGPGGKKAAEESGIYTIAGVPSAGEVPRAPAPVPSSAAPSSAIPSSAAPYMAGSLPGIDGGPPITIAPAGNRGERP